MKGSSGRFLGQLLDRMVLQKQDRIDIGENNSAHNNIPQFFAPEISNPQHPSIFNFLKFNSNSCILHTHTYPDFKVINSRFDDVGIILIKPEQDDAKEITFNSCYKNSNFVPDVDMLEKKAKKTFLDDIKFFSTDEYPKNCLVIEYKELYQIEKDKPTVLEKLKKFTGIEEVPDVAVIACNQYIEGRDRLTKQFNLR